jgi:hypothetical protein
MPAFHSRAVSPEINVRPTLRMSISDLAGGPGAICHKVENRLFSTEFMSSLSITIVWVVLAWAVTCSGAGTMVRAFSRDISRTNSPIIITAQFSSSDTGSLRGFCYADELPSGLAVTPLSVSINGANVADFSFETGQPGDVAPGCVPCRWVLETPPGLTEANPIPLPGSVQIIYAINSLTGGSFDLAQFSWAAMTAGSNAAVFGASGVSDRHTVLFDASTNALPYGALWTLWWQHTNGSLARWTMAGTTNTGSSRLMPSSSGVQWWARACGDLDGAGGVDLYFQSVEGRVAGWTMQEATRERATYLNPSRVQLGWRMLFTEDLFGNGQQDLFFQHTNGTLAIWRMIGTNAAQSFFLNPASVSTTWRLAGAGKFLVSPQPQLLWQHADGWLALWSMNGTNRVRSYYLNPPKVDPRWQVAGTIDLDGDGKSEILWRHDDGRLSYWSLNGTNRVTGGPLGRAAVDPAWRVIGAR